MEYVVSEGFLFSIASGVEAKDSTAIGVKDSHTLVSKQTMCKSAQRDQRLKTRATKITQGVTGMSNDQKSLEQGGAIENHRPCAFYQASINTGHVNRLSVEKSEGSRMKHRCMLNPGRTEGPDGKEISPMVCTMGRQGDCQKARREVFARLNGMMSVVLLEDAKV